EISPKSLRKRVRNATESAELSQSSDSQPEV
ncbi:MAG: hypothetical protein RLY59_84, partial [Actinomycetota bacterium]